MSPGGGETASKCVPADAHVAPQLQRDAVATYVFVPPRNTSTSAPHFSQHTRCHAAGHTLSLTPRKSRTDERKGGKEKSWLRRGGADANRTLHVGQNRSAKGGQTPSNSRRHI
ncbi:Hypothetical predicted protein [Xyrichtys novacula]|uniref:Uncharacterized protein n=1 Tax=Xyrichtys novacula TaxID=13765 RepID=A0AAV1GUD1_XYRNO|nr:Hypothetical predicted protein [Xyrichtys novacula]